MKYRLNARTGMMEKDVNPSEEIQNALVIIPKHNLPEFIESKSISDGLKIVRGSDNMSYLFVRFNCRWRCCGRIVKPNVIYSNARTTLINFRAVWLRGVEL